jgi:hypothetical protein
MSTSGAGPSVAVALRLHFYKNELNIDENKKNYILDFAEQDNE